ncbi:BA3454 family stress response protein [Neobacillus sp. FSL H8-0543]
MVQINVKVTFEGKSYLTNVIANRNTSEEEIYELAFLQVQKQWKNI